MKSQPPARSTTVTAVLLLLCLATSAGIAQVPDTTKKPTARDSAIVDTLKKEAQQQVLRSAHQIKWYEAAGAVALIGASTVLDQPMRRYTREHRTQTLTDLSNGFRQQGEPYYYAGISLGVWGTGVVFHSAAIQRAGRRLIVTVTAAGLMTYATKMITGRSRPNEDVGAFSFHPFTTLKDSAGIEARGSFPSGHTMAAFAVATSLSGDIDWWPASVVLYTLATGTAYSRIYDNRHWFSDTFAGALLGFTTAKIVNGHWRIFHLKPPGWLVTPTGAPALQWRVPLPPIRY
ncbi:MAG TPA: phosphatase PAP2 family protein [Gemmatimonadales bacterium]|jgi:membrane-associated phospholipid phosphatase|nr:phosphatase PAP2 family protein [Gemmatimonadales bacterium]